MDLLLTLSMCEDSFDDGWEAARNLFDNYDKGFDDYYLISLNYAIDEFKIDKDEVLEIMWASKDKIIKMMDNGDFIKYNDGFIEILFSMFNNRGTYPRER